MLAGCPEGDSEEAEYGRNEEEGVLSIHSQMSRGKRVSLVKSSRYDLMRTMLTHVDEKNQPGMVDISQKGVTARSATAEAVVEFPEGVLPEGAEEEIQTKKGPVFQTAVIAATQAVKRTADLIPFCHPLPLDGIRVQLAFRDARTIQIECTVKTTHKTGVEMEALTGASVAALTVYDMCKALTHGMVIRETRLLAKSGGKSDFQS